MTTVRVGTFNCENLFARYQFRKNIDPEEALIDGWTINQEKFDIYDDTAKSLTGKAIREAKADILGIQEVENLDTLRKFRTDYLRGRSSYPHLLAIDGNDPRRIDVGILSKFPIKGIQTHVNEYDTANRRWVFSRDCLECEIEVEEGKNITLFVNHLKSMLDRSDICNGRKNTHEKRKAQARRVKEIVESRMDVDNDDFIILGDLNDYLEEDNQGKSAITELVEWDKVENVIDHLPEDERWTQYYRGNSSCGQAGTYRQLDYLLVSKSLAERNQNPSVEIIRKGLPERAEKYTGDRFPTVGWNNPKASDHCPLIVELDV